jgi:uncharacterized protein (TIGR00369 family)
MVNSIGEPAIHSSHGPDDIMHGTRCQRREKSHKLDGPKEPGDDAPMSAEPTTTDFDLDAARRVLDDVFAPWVQDLHLALERIEAERPAAATADWQPGAVLRMPFSDRLCRQGGIVCGQALMAFADTSMVMAILAACGGYRPMTTVDQTTHFLKAVVSSDVVADARVVRLGRTMSFGRVTLTAVSDGKPVAMVSSAFAML